MRVQRRSDGLAQLAAAWSARKHEGRITLPVEVDEVALTAALIDAGLITTAEHSN
jgi:uncharacterized protein (DUF736 family)